MKKEMVNKYSCPLLIALVLLICATLAYGQPVVPGFNVEVYANVPEPAKLAFDPSGVLYVGNNGPMSMEKIYRVGIGGSPVEEYGDTPFPDPDSVAFDASGAISGTPGSVLVGNGGQPGYIAAILPDQSTITPIGPKFNIGNPAGLKFDKTGRLLVADQAPPFRALAITRTEMLVLGDSFLAITVDGSNRVYSAFLKNQIKVIASDGTPLPDLTPIDNSRDYFSNLEFGPFDEIWKGHLFATSEDSNIYRILPDGTIIKFGSGWTADNRSGLAFGPDGALYISDWIADAIYRISPSSNGSKFVDVPSDYWAEDAIYKIYDKGITTGCSQDPLMFCPEKTVYRDQMAVFLGRATHDSNFTPPPATGLFADVPKWYWAADWIEQLYADGLTKGCKIDPHDAQAPVIYYCPKYPVTRTTMAIFLLRAKHGANYQPPPATGIFEDVGVNYWAADWIEQLYREGITTGCKKNPLMYCPSNYVTRAQMAVFLTRMLGL